MHLSKYKNSFYMIVISLLLACKGEDGAVGPIGLSSLINVTNEAAGTNCENGGIRIDVGIDNNANGSLDTDEIQSTSYVCNGLDGNIGLSSVTSEPIGANCENGGLKIESGFDNNGNGTLDANEIDITRFICNGIDGGFDEQIRLAINFNANSTSSTPVTGGELINFNKNFFDGVDSIVFVTNPYVGDASNNALVELYNLTDDVVIPNSLISSNQLFADRVFLNTSNLFNDLPETEVTLGIRFSSETNGQFAASGTPYLFLYRSN